MEERIGVSGSKTTVYWLVSCKHYAQSNNSINPTIEQNVYDRVISNGCIGFIGFYSTIASSGLKDILNGISSKIAYQIFDCEKIENNVISNPKMRNIFIRFFPKSYKRWIEIHIYKEPIKLFSYYLDNEHKQKNVRMILNEIYSTTESMILSIRQHNSFVSSLNNSDKSLLIHPNLANCIMLDEYHPDLKITGNLTTNKFLRISKDIELYTGENILPDINSFGVSFKPNFSAFFITINHVVFDNNQLSMMEDVFSKLKDILD